MDYHKTMTKRERLRASMTKRFSRNVLEVRKEAGMTQDALAGQVDLLRTSISNIENGRQRILLEDLPVFAAALGVTESRLLRTPLRKDPRHDNF